MTTPVPAPPVIVWFRRDLRIADQPALSEAAASGRPVIPLYILEPAEGGNPGPGGAGLWWLHHALGALGRDLAALGAPLVLRRGPARAVLDTLIAESGADTVLWTRRYEPAAMARDAAIKADLKARGLTARSVKAGLLFEPWEIATRAGTPFRVFTPFWRACRAHLPPPSPLPAPTRLRGADSPPASESLDAWGLLPHAPDWAGGLRETWIPGEAGAHDRLNAFLAHGLDGYALGRDQAGREATSRLSPHLAFGEISPRQVATAALRAPGAGVERFLTELGWREFSVHLLHHHPDLPRRPFRAEFEAFPWRDDPEGLAAWQRGRTGFPLVDAGMRQLWHTGWMHNRVRMVAASLLVKDLLVPWQAGAAWFWDTLVDADLASNAASWQWVAGCGADAAPYFRIFNPTRQGETFDPDGAYVRRWCPELSRLPDRWLHKPWMAPPLALAEAGVRLGVTYPRPVVDHDGARARALAALATLRRD